MAWSIYIYKRNDRGDKNINKFSVILYFEKKMGRGLVAPAGITVSIMKKRNSEKKYYYRIKFKSNLNCHISSGYYLNKIKMFKLIYG